jgi:hypothetical protein
MLFLASIPYLVLSAQSDLFLWLPYASPLLAAGVFSLTRKAWWLAFVGAVLPLVLTVLLAPYAPPQGRLLGMAFFFLTPLASPFYQAIEFLAYLFMVCSAVLLVWSKAEFPGKSAADHLFGPPEGWQGTRD